MVRHFSSATGKPVSIYYLQKLVLINYYFHSKKLFYKQVLYLNSSSLSPGIAFEHCPLKKTPKAKRTDLRIVLHLLRGGRKGKKEFLTHSV